MKLGLALGGGGARGLAHVLAVEVLEEFGVRPSVISGTSIGAIVGTLYAAGLSAAELREQVEQLVPSKGKSSFLSKAGGLLQLARPEYASGGLLSAAPLLKRLTAILDVTEFAELSIKLKLVATDFWSREQVVMDSGNLVRAIHASMAIPGIFRPVERNGRVLVDGGSVNPVPFDLLRNCDVTIAINVLGQRTSRPGTIPSLLEAIFQTYQTMEHVVIQEKLKNQQPDIYCQPEIQNVRVLEFHKAKEIYSQSQPAMDQLRRDLESCLNGIET